MRDTAKALDSSPIESRRNSRSDLRPPARSPPQKLGSEQAALEVSLERARAIVAPRDAPYASDEDDVYVGRIRRDISRAGDQGLDLFVCGDQIKKGAALNAVQVAELLL